MLIKLFAKGLPNQLIEAKQLLLRGIKENKQTDETLT